MRKGKYGITYATYALAAMVFALLNQTLLSVLLLGFLIIAEKDEWTIRQSLQSCAMVFLRDLISEARYLVEKPTDWIDGFANGSFYKVHNFYDSITRFIYDGISIAIIIILFVSIFKVIKEQDANLPIVSKFADWAYGKITTPSAPTPAPAQNTTAAPNNNPVSGNAVATNNNSAANTAANTNSDERFAAPKNDKPDLKKSDAPSKKFCTKCGAEVTGAFCTKCGNKIN